MTATVSLSCERYFPETNKRGKNGKLQRICIDVRKMQIRGDFITTTGFEVNYIKRGGEFRFYVKSIVKPVKSIWQELNTRPQPIIPKWEREGNYSRDEFVAWLKARRIQNAESLVIALMTMPPENLAA